MTDALEALRAADVPAAKKQALRDALPQLQAEARAALDRLDQKLGGRVPADDLAAELAEDQRALGARLAKPDANATRPRPPRTSFGSRRRCGTWRPPTHSRHRPRPSAAPSRPPRPCVRRSGAGPRPESRRRRSGGGGRGAGRAAGSGIGPRPAGSIGVRLRPRPTPSSA